METYSLFVDGKFVKTKTAIEVKSPYDGRVGAKTFEAGKKELEAAIAAAAKAFEKTRKLSSLERGQILQQIGEGVKRERETFIQILAMEAGKPVTDAAREVDRAISNFFTGAEEAKRIFGEVLPLDLFATTKGAFGIVRRFPIGPVLAITPFNFPLNLAVHKIVPAIACGNTMVLKPPHKTPISTLHLARIVAQSALPKGALNIIVLNPQLHDALVTDERFKALSFTGSAGVGWMLKAKAGKKKVLLELGGNAGVIVDEGADAKHAAARIAYGGFSFAGQSCISVQRCYVHQSIFDEFTKHFLAEVKKIKMGDPLDPATQLGPMIEPGAVKRTETWVKEAVKAGAKLLCGGKAHGPIFEPTVLANAKKSSAVCQKEVFAPLVVLFPFKNFSKVLDEVNDSDYGLQAGVFTPSLEHALQAYETLEVGGVIVNDIPTWRVDPMPYGGVKDSGFGREGIRYVIEELTEPRLFAITRR